MPVIVAALIGGLIEAAGSMVGRVLVGLGIGLVTYTGVQALFSTLKSSAFSWLDQAASAPGVSAWMSVFHIGMCANILISAVATRLALRGLTGGGLKRWVTK